MFESFIASFICLFHSFAASIVISAVLEIKVGSIVLLRLLLQKVEVGAIRSGRFHHIMSCSMYCFSRFALPFDVILPVHFGLVSLFYATSGH